MNANVSISVTPGSDTLWSVHSGQRRWTMPLGVVDEILEAAVVEVGDGQRHQ